MFLRAGRFLLGAGGVGLRLRGLGLGLDRGYFGVALAFGGFLAQGFHACVFGALHGFAGVGDLHLFVAVLAGVDVGGVAEVEVGLGVGVGGVLLGPGGLGDAKGVVGLVELERAVLVAGYGVRDGVRAVGFSRVDAAGEKRRSWRLRARGRRWSDR